MTNWCVRWCVGWPEEGEPDLQYQSFSSSEKAWDFARQIFSKDILGEVVITECFFEPYDDDAPELGGSWTDTSNIEIYYGE